MHKLAKLSNKKIVYYLRSNYLKNKNHAERF